MRVEIKCVRSVPRSLSDLRATKTSIDLIVALNQLSHSLLIYSSLLELKTLIMGLIFYIFFQCVLR